MITSFSKFSKGIGAKIILGALTLSMIVFWGLGGLSNISFSSKTEAIKVGDETVTIRQLSDSFDKERQKMSALMGGQYLSPKDAMKAGLLMSAVQAQVIDKVQKQVKNDLGLTASDKAVQKYVERNPAFSDALGNFDKNIFYAYLAQARISEAQLAQQLKNELAMQHLNGTVMDLGYNPNVLAKILYQYKNEKRTIVGALIEPSQIPMTQKPTEDELKEFYEAYAEQFILPEFRDVSIVLITPDKMINKVAVDPAEIDAVYTEKKNSFAAPEKRQLDQMLFDSKDKADQAAKGLTAANFRQVAKEKAGQSEAQTDFGWVSKDDMLSELSDPVFAGKKNAIVGPVNTSLGWHLVLIRDIQAGTKPSESQIKAEIKKQLAGEKTYATMEETTRQLEDKLGAGDTLDQAAKSLGLTVYDIGTIDMTGLRKDGTPLPEDLKSSSLIQNVFTLGDGETSSIIEHKNGYIVARVNYIIPSAPEEFASAKPKLERLWKSEKQKEKLPSIADDILARTKKGNSLSAQGVFQNFKSFIERDITREKVNKLPAEVMEAVFAQNKGLENALAIPVKNGVFISTVESITPAKPDADEFGLNVVKQNLKSQIGEGLANEVMGSYAEELGVKINEKLIEDSFAAFNKDID